MQKVVRGPFNVAQDGRRIVIRRQVTEEMDLDVETLDLHLLNLERQKRQFLDAVAEIDEQIKAIMAFKQGTVASP